MKKRIILGMLIGVLILPGLCMAGFRIELKNGSSFVTDRYWEEGNQIKYYQYGGVLGVAKDQVKSITETDVEVPEEITGSGFDEASENRPVREGKTPDNDETRESEKSTPEKDPASAESKTTAPKESEEKESPEFQKKVNTYQEQLQQVHQEIVKNVKIYYSAMDKDDQFTMNNKRDLINELKAEKQNIKEKVLELYHGSLPDWWFDIINKY